MTRPGQGRACWRGHVPDRSWDGGSGPGNFGAEAASCVETRGLLLRSCPRGYYYTVLGTGRGRAREGRSTAREVLFLSLFSLGTDTQTARGTCLCTTFAGTRSGRTNLRAIPWRLELTNGSE